MIVQKTSQYLVNEHIPTVRRGDSGHAGQILRVPSPKKTNIQCLIQLGLSGKKVNQDSIREQVSYFYGTKISEMFDFQNIQTLMMYTFLKKGYCSKSDFGICYR